MDKASNSQEMVSEKEMLQICRRSGKAAEIIVTGRDDSKKTNRSLYHIQDVAQDEFCVYKANKYIFFLATVQTLDTKNLQLLLMLTVYPEGVWKRHSFKS